jgi:serine/threonine protein phosphatase PrpC
MSIVCAACGKISRDREFCDHCNADLQPVDDRLPPAHCPLPLGDVVLSAAQRKALMRIEDTVTLQSDAGRWRVHWARLIEQQTWRPLLNQRLGLDVEVLPKCKTIDAEGGLWVVSQASVDTCRWQERTAASDPLARMRGLLADVGSLAHALEQLHRHGLVWLTFDPAAVEDAGPLLPPADADTAALGLRLLRIANLDVRLFRQGECPMSLGFNARFAAPEVCAFRAAEIGPATDVYHLAMFAYYWCARMLPDGFGGLGLESFDHKLPSLRTYTPDLPAGVVSALMRGLAVEPSQRYATPREFVAALRGRLDETRQRRDHSGAVRWDAAGLTESGRSKDAIGKGNEDHVLLREFAEPRGLLTAVADGISTCDIGSGALASLIAGIVLENRFDHGTSHEAFERQVVEASHEGSRRILDWAIEKGYKNQLATGRDLMGTTLTVAWLQGHELSVANLGDSRAYLIAAHWVDQLTVDGDLGTELLAGGAAPEQVLRMGVVARALRGCVGGCTLNSGQVEVLPDSCRPAVTRWSVVPGDVVVLCTDGLVEEGIFLEPESMADMVRTNRALPAAELARRLVDAANAMQRMPSASEPEGFGDNITCVVIKIESEE